MFRRILIANRGEIALRVIRACRGLGVESVAVYSEGDAESPHLGQADHTICIGPARSTDSYLNMRAILQAAVQFDCSAIHPGYGFLSENALFATLCEQAKVSFIGPGAEAIRLMGDKSTARETMRRAGLPVIPGSQGTLPSAPEGERIAAAIGYPVLLKATAGGGGRGMRRVNDAAEFARLYDEASAEAEKAFGNPGLYLEKYIVDGRHIEFQVLGDAYGTIVHLGERECSVQRRHQKLVEESPSPVVDPAERDATGDMLRRALAGISYRNAGTVEFFRSPEGTLYFMEVNARLQVEHPVTEMVTGRDLVVDQIRIAANEALGYGQADVTWAGHAIECRVNAEDPDNDFRPVPGTLTAFVPPGAEGTAGTKVRVDTHAAAGMRVPPHYDSMLAKVVVHGADRARAIRGMIDALGSFRIEGVPTTIPAHLRILRDPEFAAGRYDTGFVARLLR